MNRDLLNSSLVSFVNKKNFFPILNPSNNQELAYIYKMKEEELQNIISLSHIEYKKWSSLLAIERADILLEWYKLIIKYKNDLAKIITLEMGKPINESLGEIQYAASFIRWFAEECRRIDGDIIQSNNKNQKILVLKQPIGVCAAITPWNFPAAMITRKVAPALACGCSIIVKPATQTPLSAIALVNLARKAGVPNNIFEVVTGDTLMISDALCKSNIVKKISFTGSTQVGRKLMASSAGTIKKLSLELGGNAPFIIFNDTNIESAISGIITSKFRNTGQTCVCANRIYIQNEIYDEVAKELKKEVEKFNVGDGLQKGVNQGPLINKQALAKVKEHINDAVSKGGNIILGGKPHHMGGNFFEPTIITNINQDMLVAKEETFGPLAPLFKFTTEEEVIQMANNTEFGLASYIYTKDITRLWRVAEALEYGMVGANTGIISTEVAPFGGVKQSGLGREGSKYGIEDYLEIKYICLDIK